MIDAIYSRLRSSYKKNLSQKFATFSQDFRNVHQEAEKARLCQYYETPVEGPFGTYSLQWIYLLLLSSVPLLRMDQSPQEGGGLDVQVSQFQQNDGERVFETVAG